MGTNPMGTNPMGTNPMRTNPMGTNPLGNNRLGNNPQVTTILGTTTLGTITHCGGQVQASLKGHDNDSNSDTGLSSLHSSSEEGVYILDTLV